MLRGEVRWFASPFLGVGTCLKPYRQNEFTCDNEFGKDRLGSEEEKGGMRYVVSEFQFKLKWPAFDLARGNSCISQPGQCTVGVYVSISASETWGCVRLVLSLTLLHDVCPPLYPIHFLFLFPSRIMSNSSSSNILSLFDAALESYQKQTGTKLIDHPLAKELENCNSVDAIMDVLQQQARAFTEFRGDDSKIRKSLKRTVQVLHALSTSTTLSEGVGLVRRMTSLGIPSF
jgi:hypothetical protein